jgi:transcriptional regulator with XRE-family HTH domain
MTQLQLAELSGVSHEAISRLELGTRGPRAKTLDRLAASLGVAPSEIVAPPSIAPEPNAVPSGQWMTVEAAAEALDRSPEDVRKLVRLGRLKPAAKERVGGRGHLRWQIDAAAVAAFRAPRHRRETPHRQEPPAGHLAVGDVAAATGLPRATLQRKLLDGTLSSIKVGFRRWIPATELSQLDHQADS